MSDRRMERARRMGLTHSTAEAYYQRGLKAHEDGDLENAILDLSEAIYYDRGFPEFYATRGLFHIEAQKPEEAEEDLNYAIKLKPRLWVAHFGLGLLRFNEGDYAAARDIFQHVTQIIADRGEVWFYLAVSHAQLEDWSAALAAIDKALPLFNDADRRIRDARAWKREIDGKIAEINPQAADLVRKGGKKLDRDDK